MTVSNSVIAITFEHFSFVKARLAEEKAELRKKSINKIINLDFSNDRVEKKKEKSAERALNEK